jgi:phosphohistidine swiveling domain-containing protein
VNSNDDLPWTSEQSSKVEGLRLLIASDLPVPRTYTLASTAENDVIGLARKLSDEGGEWVVRVDAPPRERFSIRGGKVPLGEASAFLCAIWHQLPTARCSIIAQRLLIRRLDGIAFKTARGITIIEVQPASSRGNFFRDGSTPWRWIIAEDGAIHSSPDGGELPPMVQPALRAAFERLPGGYCVEWVLDGDDSCVYFVDAKHVASSFLDAIDGPIPSGGCVPVWCGKAEGVALNVSTESKDSHGDFHLLVAERPSIDVLSLLNHWTRGIVFRSGGLLAHAVVYASQLGVPMVICSESILTHELQGNWAELVVGPSQHWLKRHFS